MKTLYICKKDDLLNILIPLFDNFPSSARFVSGPLSGSAHKTLNGVKHLDFLCFKECVSIKLNDSIPKDEKLRLITSLKDSMNTKRVNYEMPDNHSIRITPY